MGGNGFETMDEDAYVGQPSLRALDLSGCPKLSRLDSHALVFIPNLETLNLSNTNLQYWNGAFVTHVENLKVLDLSNTVRRIPDDAFEYVPNLEKIYLRNGYLKSLSPSVFQKLDKLKIIDISRNPWQCDHQLRELIKFFHFSTIHLQNSNDTVCVWPYSLDGRRIMDLDCDIPSYFGELDAFSNENENDDVDESMFNSSDIYKPEATIQFKINNTSELVNQTTIFINGLSWRIKVKFIRSALSTVHFDLLSEGPSQTSNWSCFTEVAITMVSQRKKKRRRGMEDRAWRFSKTFHNNQNTEDTSYLISFYELERFYVKYDNTVTLEVYLYMHTPKFGMTFRWDNQGYLGLVNQGATCYLNTVMQTLFHLKKIRKAIYQIPTQSNSKSVILALQRVFYDLEHSEKPVSTKRLTESFGWGTSEVLLQHDVSEFMQVLTDNIEKAMRGTSAENLFREIFQSTMKTSVVGKQVEFHKERVENFYTLTLNTQFLNNINESFNQFLEGEDIIYWTDNHGKQPAERTYQFVNFAPVLIVQLKRFYWDEKLRRNRKYSDRRYICRFC